MPITVGGVLHYLYPRAVVVDASGNPVEGLSGAVVTLTDDPTPLVPLEFSSQVPIANLSTGALGLLPDVWLPVGPRPVSVAIDWPDDVPSQVWSPAPDEVMGYLEGLVEGATADAVEAVLVEGDNITIERVADTLVISSTASGGSGSGGF